MPVFKQHLVVGVARGIRAFLNLEVGVTRTGASPEPGWDGSRVLTVPEPAKPQPGKGLKKLKERIAAKDRKLEQTRQLLASKERELAELRAKLDGADTFRGVNARNIVWIFGSGRSGSTWLSSMMGDLSGQTMWGEPWVGRLFGDFYYVQVDEQKHRVPQFIMGRYKESWLRSIRYFILNAAAATFPDLEEDDYLVIKEPNGSVGAPLLMEALPESRMVLLVRDPRDIVASSADAFDEGGWNSKKNKRRRPQDKRSVAVAERRARACLQQLGRAKEAFDAHQGHKVLIKYEDLRAETLGTMKRLYSTLGIKVDEEELARAVKKHSWEAIPEEEKGEGKFYRKASPGSWREDLTEEQVEVVERITAPLLKEFYPA